MYFKKKRSSASVKLSISLLVYLYVCLSLCLHLLCCSGSSFFPRPTSTAPPFFHGSSNQLATFPAHSLTFLNTLVFIFRFAVCNPSWIRPVKGKRARFLWNIPIAGNQLKYQFPRTLEMLSNSLCAERIRLRLTDWVGHNTLITLLGRYFWQAEELMTADYMDGERPRSASRRLRY